MDKNNKVYVVSLNPRGELLFSCDDEVYVFKKKEDAISKVLEICNEDIQYYNYVVNTEELKALKDGESNCLTIFYKEIQNYEMYYELTIFETNIQ